MDTFETPSAYDMAVGNYAAQNAISENENKKKLWQNEKLAAQQEAQGIYGQTPALASQYQQALSERKNRLERGLSEQEANAIKQQGQANLAQLQASQGRSGVKGGAALAQQQGVMTTTSNTLANAQAKAKEEALNSYERDVAKRIYGIQGAGTAAQQLAAQQYATDKGVAIANQAAPTPSRGLLGTVLCTLAFNKGDIPDYVYYADSAYGKTLSDITMKGYQLWAIPLAVFLNHNNFCYKLVLPIIKKWSWHMYGKKSITGYVCKFIGIPLCNIIGRLTK